MKATISRSAIIASVLLIGLIVFSAQTSIAETLLFQLQPQKESKENPADPLGKIEPAEAPPNAASLAEQPKALVPASPYVATAYSLRGRTASGRMVTRGLIAADPSVLPLGSRVKLEHPGYSGEYLVADTGGAIRGRRIDIWTPSSREAMRFGRRTVKLTVLSYGARRSRRTAKG
jgi:3D (Asp-Asp-Asp) domain-containing protein